MGVVVDCFQKFSHLGIIQGLNFFFLPARRFTCVGGIDPEIAHLNGLLQRLVQYTVHIADRLWRKRVDPFPVRVEQRIVKLLNHRSRQSFQLDRAQVGDNVLVNVAAIQICGRFFHVAQIVHSPYVKPLFKRLLFGFCR